MGPVMQSNRILVAGAGSDIGLELLKRLSQQTCLVGVHVYRSQDRVRDAVSVMSGRSCLLTADLRGQTACWKLVDDFCAWSGGLDALVQLCGDVSHPCDWATLPEDDWESDMRINLGAPFYLSQRAVYHMRQQGSGGKIVAMSTASAAHGGGTASLAYGMAKAGVECLVKALARDCATDGILVNAIAPGFIETRFHTQRMGRNEAELRAREKLVPLKRAGKTRDVAEMIVYLLSDSADYITGQTIAISGGDWL